MKVTYAVRYETGWSAEKTKVFEEGDSEHVSLEATLATLHGVRPGCVFVSDVENVR